MSINGISSRSSLMLQSMVEMRRQLDDLQRQLGTGRRSVTYAGLGINRGLAISVNNQLAALKSYNASMQQVSVRLDLAQTALGQIDSVTHEVKTAIFQSKFAIDPGGQTAEQRNAGNQLELVLGLLNTTAGDRYLFSGLGFDTPSVESSVHILEGDGARAGLKQMISERRQADLGAAGMGRLSIPAAVGATLSVAEDAAGSPFGMKLAAVNSTLTGATVTGPAGAPASVSIDLGATNPAAGDSIRLSFTLPDGSTTDLTLTATASASPGANEFSLGANAAATAGNLQAALTTAVAGIAGSELAAASALAAGDAFFSADLNNPPQRVNGPPFATATSLVAGTAANSVIWYTGEAGADPARSTANARIDASISVSYGLRANEEALQSAVKNIAVFAAVSYSSGDPQAAASYGALKQRVAANLANVPGQQKISDIAAEIASAQTAMAAASERHQQTDATLADLMESITTVSPEEVGAKILALQTNLQASLQTTALLLQTSLINYL
ncbi:MAG TPA: flagellar biosynthesis protein FlgL [Xanthobacteraceae bacterium]|nr:flagellar biosynthesis protein FlgL [Xanthobacteraceae bacterium]